VADRALYAWVTVVSAVLMSFLFWLIYAREGAGATSGVVAWLPWANAGFNTASALCLALGWRAIRAGRRELHQRAMLSAVGFSAAFLVSYMVYHYAHGDTPFPGQGLARGVYLGVLASHVLTTIVALPMILLVLYYAASGRFQDHRRIARRTFPLWMYVSVTGVLIFAMLRVWS
jgi:putative membrane protein